MKRISKASFFLFLAILTSLSPFHAIHAGTHTPEEELVSVALGAFKDGFFDIAEKQLQEFTETYPQHEKINEIQYLLGKVLLLKGELAEAKKAFLKVLQEKKNTDYIGHTLFWLGHIENRIGSPEAAKKHFLSLTKNYPKFEWMDYTYYLLGLLELSGSKFAQAEVYLKKVFPLSKREDLIQSSRFWLGILSYRQKDFEAAVGLLKASCENSKHLPQGFWKPALFWLGEAQVKLHRFREAKETYFLFLNRFKNDSLAGHVSWKIGFCEYRLGNTKPALDLFGSFKSQFHDPKLTSYASYLMAEALLAEGDPLSSVRELLLITHSSQTGPLLGAALLHLYWNYLHLGEREEASRIFQKLQKASPFEDERIYLQWLAGELAFSEGRIWDSLPYYFNLLNTRFREKVLFEIGKVYFFQNNFQEAVINLDILALEFPASKYLDQGLFMKGESLFRSGNLDLASETYRLLAKRSKKDVWHLLSLTQVGILCLLQERLGEAGEAFKAAMEIFQDHPLFCYAAFQLGNLHFKERDLTEASRYYSLALKGNMALLLGETYFRFGEIFYLQGKYEKAMTSFETALPHLKEGSSCFSLTQLEMANLLRRWGKKEEARKSYKAVLDHSKDEAIKKAAIELMGHIDQR